MTIVTTTFLAVSYSQHVTNSSQIIQGPLLSINSRNFIGNKNAAIFVIVVQADAVIRALWLEI